MGRRGYSAEFRRMVLDLLALGRSVASVAHDLDVRDQTIYSCASRIASTAGLSLLTTKENAELPTRRQQRAVVDGSGRRSTRAPRRPEG